MNKCANVHTNCPEVPKYKLTIIDQLSEHQLLKNDSDPRTRPSIHPQIHPYMQLTMNCQGHELIDCGTTYLRDNGPEKLRNNTMLLNNQKIAPKQTICINYRLSATV
jgi:hypothetical protein